MAQAQTIDHLGTLRTQARLLGAQVFGEGNPQAKLMIVGEAPGEVEAAQGRPFVGPSGAMLNRLLSSLGIPRGELWITNVVKVRPVRDTGAGAVNRPPRASEIATFRPILLQEIQIIQPRVIVCLGAVAAKALIHPDFRITQEHGQWYDGPNNSKVTATYHPSNLVRLRPPDDEPIRAAMVADLALAWKAAAAS